MFRKQYGDDQDKISLESGLSCPLDEDTCRQEFAQESDINRILARYGVNVPQLRPQYGEVDMDMSYQDAVNASREVSEAFYASVDLQQKYGTLAAFLTASQGLNTTPATAADSSAVVDGVEQEKAGQEVK